MDRREKHKSHRPPQNPVRIANQQKDLALVSSAARKIAHVVLDLEKSNCRELTIYFVSERRICGLHQMYFADPSPTDCISFPIDSEILGDVFVCPKTAIEYAKKHNSDIYEEVALYIIHGILHLLGFDDLTPSDRRIMRKKEKKCMAACKEMIELLRPQ